MKIGKWFVTFSVRLKIRKTEETRGLSSICEDLKHIVCLDYDKIDKNVVVKELKYIQKKFGLTPFYLFTTEEKEEKGITIGNYHARSITKLTPSEVMTIQKNTHCDSNYITMPIRNKFRSWVMRDTIKGNKQPPEYIGIIGEKINLDNETSKGHLNFLKSVYGVDDVSYTNLDCYETVEGHKYTTFNV